MATNDQQGTACPKHDEGLDASTPAINTPVVQRRLITRARVQPYRLPKSFVKASARSCTNLVPSPLPSPASSITSSITYFVQCHVSWTSNLIPFLNEQTGGSLQEDDMALGLNHDSLDNVLFPCYQILSPCWLIPLVLGLTLLFCPYHGAEILLYTAILAPLKLFRPQNTVSLRGPIFSPTFYPCYMAHQASLRHTPRLSYRYSGPLRCVWPSRPLP